ncbi:ABC transporter permease [Bacillus sp. DJP31]|uniref:ABC transporter permease n=1 Tax=Bacillus sp. DJP31 TaxID=3409789 RepID=UPI003BB53A77
MRITALVTRIIRQFMRDKRTLGMMIVAPILVLSLISVVFSGEDVQPNIGLVHLNEVMVNAFEDEGLTTIEYSTNEAAVEGAKQAEIHGFIEMENNLLEITLEGSDPAKNKAVLVTIQSTLQKLKSPLEAEEPIITYIHGSEDMETFDYIGPFLIGFFAFFFVFLIAGVSFLRERTTGTLERLLSTPLRRWEIVTGYVIGYGIFTTIQSIIIVWFSIKVLGIMMAGSFFYVLLITFMLSITALTLGTLLSAFAKNELQMIQFIPIVVVPQVFFSGLFAIETMPNWLQSLSVVMPLTYGGAAMREVMIRGGGWVSISTEVFVLLGFSLLFMVLNTLALKRHRRL